MQLRSGSRYFLENPEIYFRALHSHEQNTFSTLGSDLSGGVVVVFKPNGMQNLFHLSNSELFGYVVEGKSILRNNSELLWQELKNTSDIFKSNKSYF